MALLPCELSLNFIDSRLLQCVNYIASDAIRKLVTTTSLFTTNTVDTYQVGTDSDGGSVELHWRRFTYWSPG